MNISKEGLKKCEKIENNFITALKIDGNLIEIRIDPDDVEIDETIALANKILKDFGKYERAAKAIIAENFLETYNDNWREDEDPVLTKEQFLQNLELDGINFLSNESIDIFYQENGMFGHHSLIAQSFDGENFEDATMFG